MDELAFDRDFELDKNNADQQLKKLNELREFLKGKELSLKKREVELREKELQLRVYRKNLLLAIKEQLSGAYSHEESIKVLARYRDILQFIAQDIKDELDDIMG